MVSQSRVIKEEKKEEMLMGSFKSKALAAFHKLLVDDSFIKKIKTHKHFLSLFIPLSQNPFNP